MEFIASMLKVTTKEAFFYVFAMSIFLKFPVTQSEVVDGGACPSKIQTSSQFDIFRFIGRWYYYSQYPVIFELDTKCNYIEFTLLPNDKLSVHNSKLKVNNNKDDVNGIATVIGPGKLSVSFPTLEDLPRSMDYWILTTDYRNYAVAYSCSEIFGIFHRTALWILTRQRSPLSVEIETAVAIIRDLGFPLAELQRSIQEDCPEM